jgi:HD superfamily phosphohydrolase YqeK
VSKIHGTVGDYYVADYWVSGEDVVREIKIHTLKHHDVDIQIVDAVAQKEKCDPERVGFFHAVRVIQ